MTDTPDRRAAMLAKLQEQLGRVILGKNEVIQNVVIALLSGGHILMEDVPGVGKTTLAKALAKSLAADFKRVQFTPDLLPTDILGSSVYNPRDGAFTLKTGPILPTSCWRTRSIAPRRKAQSALLEAME